MALSPEPAEYGSLDEDCPKCGQVVGDHTLFQIKECWPGNDNPDLNFEFREDARGVTMESAGGKQYMAGGLVVIAATYDTVVQSVPMLIFRFVMPDGLTPYPDFVLGLDADGWRRMKTLLTTSIDKAVSQARKKDKERQDVLRRGR